jgi:serine/threonine protein kinase
MTIPEFVPKMFCSFLLLKQLVTSRATLWLAKKKEKLYVLKCADFWNQKKLVIELQNESAMYDFLKPLQGKYLLKLHSADYMGGIYFALIFSFLGEDLSKSEYFKKNPLFVNKMAVKGLRAIHEAGVLHGDIRLENILCVASVKNPSNRPKIIFIDFGFSKILEDKNSPKFVEEQQQLSKVLSQ